jgi:two-component system alkaline phosphatase synthesis response regulator PhoP
MIKILVVDDDPFTTQILEITFRQEGYDLRATNDSTQALAAALEFNPDIVLLDITMPIKDGIQVCADLRAEPALKNTSIIMLTAVEDSGKRAAAFQAGASEFLTKPIHPREFREQIAGWARDHGHS